jgi:hypothetical protein
MFDYAVPMHESNADTYAGETEVLLKQIEMSFTG